ncbi:AAA family ATPase [Pseudoalteromonas luteoviolacea]|uniref:AAA family ATPase n=1 Tax=Pseudoalteromonas luteoviolacea TaxID=43657 RepID=UPI0031BBB8C1|nr:AAA family ATPase [Pseudoalteromonas luteoviolacea]
MLCRTIKSLASYFEVSIDTLLQDTDTPPWIYSHLIRDMPLPCFGREWELQQFHTILNQAVKHSALQTIYLQGMTGAGKTALLNTFVAQLKAANQSSLYFLCPAPSLKNQGRSAIAGLVRALLSINEETSHAAIESKVYTVATGPLSILRLYQWLGLALNEHESQALDVLCTVRKQQLDAQLIQQLLRYIAHKGIVNMVIDDAHNLTAKELYFVSQFAQSDCPQPMLLIISAQQKRFFVQPPSWLTRAHSIAVKPLDKQSMHQLANYILRSQGVLVASQQRRVIAAIERAEGNPSFLKQLLCDDYTATEVPDTLQLLALSSLNNMPCDVANTLKFAASLGQYFDTQQLQSFNEYHEIRAPLCVLHKMLCSGLIRQNEDRFSFVHPLIQEALKSLVHETEFSWYISGSFDHIQGKTEQVTRI